MRWGRLILIVLLYAAVAAALWALPQRYVIPVADGQYFVGQGTAPGVIAHGRDASLGVTDHVVAEGVIAFATWPYDYSQAVLELEDGRFVLSRQLRSYAVEVVAGPADSVDDLLARSRDLTPETLQWQAPSFWTHAEGIKRLALLAVLAVVMIVVAMRWAIRPAPAPDTPDAPGDADRAAPADRPGDA